MIKIINITKNPLSLMGEMAGICTNRKTNFRQIGIDCLESNHGRVLEYPDVILEISGYSARVVREIYTHIIGTTRLQESTRYVEYGEFDYFTPDLIKENADALAVYDKCMRHISEAYDELEAYDISKEDIANILPLGMMTKVVLKINLRALIHMANIRLCSRALKEYRTFMTDLITFLSHQDDDWKYICDNYLVAKCEVHGYCTEKNSCGRRDRKV